MGLFDGLRARLDQMLAEHDHLGGRDAAQALRDAVIEAKAGVAGMRDALERSERDLELERRAHDDAARRGALAAEISDAETQQVAERFAARHRERMAILEQKLEVQRAELALAQRELDEMMHEFRARRSGEGALPAHERAWQDVQAAGGERPGVDLDAEITRAEADRRLHEAAVEAQLEHLKRKLGRRTD